jgi:hypothetical protein
MVAIPDGARASKATHIQIELPALDGMASEWRLAPFLDRRTREQLAPQKPRFFHMFPLSAIRQKDNVLLQRPTSGVPASNRETFPLHVEATCFTLKGGRDGDLTLEIIGEPRQWRLWGQGADPWRESVATCCDGRRPSLPSISMEMASTISSWEPASTWVYRPRTHRVNPGRSTRGVQFWGLGCPSWGGASSKGGAWSWARCRHTALALQPCGEWPAEKKFGNFLSTS